MDDTIAAISTPEGAGGIAIVRVSGADAIEIADKIFSADITAAPSHTVHYGHVKNERGETVDEALLTVMRAPKTFS